MTLESAFSNSMKRTCSSGLSMILVFLILSGGLASAQRVIAVQTPMFNKDFLWYSCNFTKFRNDRGQDSSNLLVDTREGVIGKELEEKKTYERELINLVNFSNRAFEGISRKLTKPMEPLRGYKFSFSASRDTSYRFSLDHPAEYKKRPLKLYVFGSNGNCGLEELLAPPFEIINHNWEKYQINLRATKPWTHVVIYAALEKNDSSVELANQSYLMLSQQEPIVETNSRFRRAREAHDPGIFNISAYSTLSFGGILMMYEITPKSINIFSKDGEIIVSDTLRKDLDRNQKLDSILHKFRGIDFLFLVMKEKKYGKKRLNIISYLKTKYPEILAQSKVMKYSTLVSVRKNKTLLKDLYKLENDIGDLLIVEKVREFVKK